jgi:hypothetical protein
MKIKYIVLTALTLLVLFACKDFKNTVDLPAPEPVAYGADSLRLSKDQYYDRVLGALVGSAIGDAMGASTEMWYRCDIRLRYGYILGHTPSVRNQSPEGPWGPNLSAGATTDDTRWKYLMVKYFDRYHKQMTPSNFAKFIGEYYESIAKTLADKDILSNPDAVDDKIEKLDWIKEWARVAMAYSEGDQEYQQALNRFYGGEMSCAGQLYTPMFGLVAETPDEAYKLGYEHAIFDIGYAKDISALVAAITNMALRTQNIDSILNTVTFVDPLGYQDSRLVGRIAYSVADGAIRNVLETKQSVLPDTLTPTEALAYKIPSGFPGTKEDWMRQEMLYQLLEKDEKSIPFHSGEIWEILITSLKFGEGDFKKTLQFIINYGRDNDTVGAVAGMILGAKDGFSRLPEDLRSQTIQVNRDVLGIDLEALAKEMVADFK